jgi:hypothetical protein
MVCKTCGRWKRAADSRPPEARVCCCAEDHTALLKILSLLAACGVDPAAPPVLEPVRKP